MNLIVLYLFFSSLMLHFIVQKYSQHLFSDIATLIKTQIWLSMAVVCSSFMMIRTETFWLSVVASVVSIFYSYRFIQLIAIKSEMEEIEELNGVEVQEKVKGE